MTSPIKPPFTREAAIAKTQMAEDAWNTRDAESGHWYRTHGNEHWEFDEDGLMRKRDVSANDISIHETDRRL